jgi:hypothetical protein
MRSCMSLGNLGNRGVLFKIDFEKAYDKVKWEFIQDILCRRGFP